ncbi:FAD-dependent monooxygenase [Colwellia sp. MEBiC06753]
MNKYDVLIIGGGMVGLTLVLAIRKLTSFTVAIVEPNPPQTSTADFSVDSSLQPEIRVSAINAASEQIFKQIGVWPLICQQRLQSYCHMHVWDKGAAGALDFDISDLTERRERDNLGHIIENSVIRNALWQQAEQDAGISIFSQEPLQNLAMGEHEVFASFASLPPIMARLVVGADGANSWLRKQLDMPIAFRDYDNHAIVATVECQQGHQDTAWQVFLAEGPLAFLPLYQENLCSIVWSTSPSEAKRIMALSTEDMAKELVAASDGKLGNIKVASELASFPLTMRLAHKFIKDRAVLIGDAAHTIHPLAGQGVNLGLLDAVSLAQCLADEKLAGSLNENIERTLSRYSRWRRSEAANMVAAMELIKQAFTPQHPIAKITRGLGMNLLSNIGPIKSVFIKQALGVNGDLPKLATDQ